MRQIGPGSTPECVKQKIYLRQLQQERLSRLHVQNRPVHVLEVQPTAQSETIQDCMRSLETAQQQNPSIETMLYSTPYFISREELPQANCNSLQTVQVSRLGANDNERHIGIPNIRQNPSKTQELYQLPGNTCTTTTTTFSLLR